MELFLRATIGVLSRVNRHLFISLQEMSHNMKFAETFSLVFMVAYANGHLMVKRSKWRGYHAAFMASPGLLTSLLDSSVICYGI